MHDYSFLPVKVNKKRYSVNLSDKKDYCINLTEKGKSFVRTMSYVGSRAFSFQINFYPLKLYTYLDDLYFMGNDAYIYKFNSARTNYSRLSYVQMNSYPQAFISIKRNGEDIPLICAKETSLIVDGYDEKVVTLPSGNAFMSYGNKLLYAKDNCIFFTDDIDASEITDTIDFPGEIYVDEYVGEVLFLADLSDEIYAIGKKGIAKLTLQNDSITYTCKRLKIQSLNIQKESIVQMGNIVYFVSDGKLKRLKNGKVDNVKSCLDDVNVLDFGVAVSCENKYIVKVSLPNETNLMGLVFDEITNESYFIYCPSLIANGGYGYEGSSSKFMTLSKEYNDSEAKYVSKPIFLESSGKQNLVAINIGAKGVGQIVLQRDREAVYYVFTNSCKIPTNIKSDRFYVTVYSFSGNFELDYISLDYIKRGD